MSSLDRAFFRAYAKEQPATTVEPEAAAPTEGSSPYVHFQSQRRPQLRYRLEPTHAPWGVVPSTAAASPHVSSEEEDYRLAADEVPAAWLSEGEAHLAKPEQLPMPSVAAATGVAPVEAKAAPVPATISVPIDPFGSGIVCLPGMDVPETDYLSTLAPIPQAIDVPSPAPEIVEQRPVAEVAPEARSQLAAVAAEPLEKVKAEVGSSADRAPAVEDRAALLADEASAFWEVDRYLYPVITDRLLSRYDYFAHAGDKLKQAAQAGLKTLGITGVGRDEGRSTLAICLARAAARSGLKVALVDCDFQRPRLAQHIGLDVTSGWESVVLGEISLAEVAIRSLEDGVTLLPLLDEAKSGPLSLGDERVAGIVAQARQANDVVILDVGPLNSSTDGSPIAPLDAAIVVWDRRRRKLEEAEKIAKTLSSAGVGAVGIAENFAG